MAGEPVSFLAPRAWEAALRARLDASGGAQVRFRLVRSDGRRAIAEVDGSDLGLARTAWNRAEGLPGPGLASRRTWGTLVGAKRWLREGPERAPRRGTGPPAA